MNSAKIDAPAKQNQAGLMGSYDQTYDLAMEIDNFSVEDAQWDYDGRLASAEISAQNGATKRQVAMIYGNKIADLVCS